MGHNKPDIQTTLPLKATFTHRQLVEIAYNWILKNASVGVAFKELKSLASEIPDVIGFGAWESVMIEVKVSRSDFLSDKKKPHRSKGMGNWRFYCCPKGMIRVDELPAGWGLIYVDEAGKPRVCHECRWKEGKRWNRAAENRFECDMQEERRIMYTALRRLFLRGYMDSIYTMTE